jgi:hypothetical protein
MLGIRRNYRRAGLVIGVILYFRVRSHGVSRGYAVFQTAWRLSKLASQLYLRCFVRGLEQRICRFFSLECSRNPFLIRTLIARNKVSLDIPLVRTCDKISFVLFGMCLFFDHDLPKKHISRFHSDSRCQIYPQCARRQLECLNILARWFLWKLIRIC